MAMSYESILNQWVFSYKWLKWASYKVARPILRNEDKSFIILQDLSRAVAVLFWKESAEGAIRSWVSPFLMVLQVRPTGRRPSAEEVFTGGYYFYWICPGNTLWFPRSWTVLMESNVLVSFLDLLPLCPAGADGKGWIDMFTILLFLQEN